MLPLPNKLIEFKTKGLRVSAIFVKKRIIYFLWQWWYKKQAAHLIQSFRGGERENTLKLANILPFDVDAETMVAMKVDLSIPWEKLKNISR